MYRNNKTLKNALYDKINKQTHCNHQIMKQIDDVSKQKILHYYKEIPSQSTPISLGVLTKIFVISMQIEGNCWAHQ